MRLVIGTFNVQNKYKLYKYAGIDKDGKHYKTLSNMLSKYKIDILGVQELVKRYEANLLGELKNSKYNIVGAYRFTKYGKYVPIVNKFNEANSIITKHKILSTKTIHLPFLPNIPRIATIAQIEVGNKKINVVNTHLDFISNKVKRKQLAKLIEIIKTFKYPTILMGDFNLTIKSEIFKDFILEMKKLGLVHVLSKESTHIHKENPIDHIFIPKEWKVEKIEVLDYLTNMSDHKPIIITVCN